MQCLDKILALPAEIRNYDVRRPARLREFLTITDGMELKRSVVGRDHSLLRLRSHEIAYTLCEALSSLLFFFITCMYLALVGIILWFLL